jgi:hypothetical protein
MFWNRTPDIDLGDVIFPSQYHYPDFPMVVVGLKPLTVMKFFYRPVAGTIAFTEVCRPSEWKECDPLPEKVEDWIDTAYDEFMKNGTYPTGQMNLNGKEPDDITASDAGCEPAPESYDVEVTYENGSKRNLLVKVPRDRALIFYHKIRAAMKSGEFFEYSYSNAKICVDGRKLAAVVMIEPETSK